MNAAFGWSLGMGDVNGDGKADIAVGSFGENVGDNDQQGRVHVFSGANGSFLFTLDAPNPQRQLCFGCSLAVGDVNDDGKADIAVGASHEEVGGYEWQGRAYVFSGVDGSLLFALDTPNPDRMAWFGTSLAVGDVNGDGKRDIAVGSPAEDVERVYVFSGANGSLLTTLNSPQAEAVGFGESVAVGDVGADGKGDIAVGAPTETVSAISGQGRAYVFSGASSSLLFTLDSPHAAEFSHFGSSLVVGDVNGDGKADITVGAPDEEVGGNQWQGRAYVFWGVNGSLLFALDSPNPQSGESYFGTSLFVADMNTDGNGDIAVGAPWEDVDGNLNQGRAYVFLGGAPDVDGDGFPDVVDTCPSAYNPDQTTNDGQRRPNGSQIPGQWASNPALDAPSVACTDPGDPDDDNDGLPDTAENDTSCPYRLVGDSDGDRVLDGYEVVQGKDPCDPANKPPYSPSPDSDSDGFMDSIEHAGYNTCAFVNDTTPGYYTDCSGFVDSNADTIADSTDSDGDGCADWVEIVDIDGSRSATVLDVLHFAKRAFGVIPPSDSDALFDLNKNGVVNLLDALLAAQNSTLVRNNFPCASEG